MDETEFKMLYALKSGAFPKNKELTDYMLERGYLFESKAQEDELIQQALEKFNDERKNTQIQLMLIPTYGCNLACTYCYQNGIQNKGDVISPETVDAFFAYINRKFNSRKVRPFITLFGGEPLIGSQGQKEIIEYILNRCKNDKYEIAVVTNGFDLIDYIDLLSKVRVKEIQVTIDGSENIHDSRRITGNGKGSFSKIIAGLAEIIALGIPVNLRTVVDRGNIHSLVDFARFVDKRGWLDLAPGLFKTQIGRNYELFNCYKYSQDLFSQIELWLQFVKLSDEFPFLKRFHRPDFKGIRYLVETGNVYIASFDTCPAAKTEWVFDLHGDIYGCTASCGREEYRIGTFYPEVTLKDEVYQWQQRNVQNIAECRACQYNLICGGGCGIIAHRKNGKILSPDCRPIQQLFELGVNYYAKEIRFMADSGN